MGINIILRGKFKISKGTEKSGINKIEKKDCADLYGNSRQH